MIIALCLTPFFLAMPCCFLFSTTVPLAVWQPSIWCIYLHVPVSLTSIPLSTSLLCMEASGVSYCLSPSLNPKEIWLLIGGSWLNASESPPP